MSTLQPLQLKSGAMAKGSGDTPLARDVSVGSDDFTNGAHYRMPWAVSRDLQPAAITGKELYFRVTDPLLRDAANGGAVRTGFDFELSTFAGAKVPYVIKSYDGVAGTLMGVLNGDLAGSGAATRGFLYFSNPVWSVSREDPDQTFPNATSVLFLPSKVDKSGSKLDLNRDLPTSDKVIVNPGALCDGDAAGNDFMTRNLTGNCGDFLISFLAQSIPNNSDNSPISFGAATGGNTMIFIRHLYADASANTDTSPHHKNAWRAGFSTSEGNSYYETADDIADTSLQHVVMRRVSGSHLELYVNGVLIPWAYRQIPGASPQSARIDFTSQVLYIGRGAVASSRFWEGYLDCFKFFKDDAKSATWALAEYSNLMDIDGGVIFGSPETVTTSSVWGEAIKVTVDPQLTSVDFKADKYSATLGGSISLRSPNPFDSSTIGTLTDRGANTVRYTNTLAQDPDNDCAVHLTNGSGNVIIPVRAHIIVTGPPPPSGYYKTPNHKLKGKTAVPCGNRGALIQAIADFKSGAHSYSAVTHYINITGDCGTRATRGADIVINTGGTRSDPLVITMDTGAGTDSNWSSRPTIYNSALVTTAPWVWLYALQLEGRPRSSDGAFNSSGDQNCVTPQAANTFVTACRMDTLVGIWGDGGSATYNGSNFSFNRFEMAQSNATKTGGGNSTTAIRNSDGVGADATAHQLTIVYNYMIESTGSIVDQSVSWRGFSFGNGHPDAGRLRTIGTEIAYNYFNCDFSHAVEMKRMPDKIHHNHMVGGRNGPYTRGENADGPTSPTASDPRPLYFANRIGTSLGCNINCGHADFISHWQLNQAASGNAEFSLFAPGTQAGKDIAGASGCRLVSCKGNLIIGDATFEPTLYTYGNISDITISNHLSGTIQDTARSSVGFSPYPPGPGTATGTHTNMTKNTIRRQDAILSGLPVTPEDPPILSTTLTGPGAAGKTWDQ